VDDLYWLISHGVKSGPPSFVTPDDFEEAALERRHIQMSGSVNGNRLVEHLRRAGDR
jgi:hypothetical protein